MIRIHDVNGGVHFCLKLTEQKAARNVDLFDESSPFLKQFMYVSLGVLAGLLLTGTLWDIFNRKKKKIIQTTVYGKDIHF